jgi:ribokinase
MAGSRIAVVGSCMMDLVVRAPRLPVLGETVFAHSFATFVGGKGNNQAIAAARLGAAHVSLIGKVGDDEFGRQILETAAAAGVDCTHVVQDRTAGTGIAVPLVFDDGQNSIFSIPRANMALTAADVEAAASAIRASDILLLQFEVPGECDVAAARIASAQRIPVILNTAPVAPMPAGLLEHVTWIVANETEAAAFAPTGDTDEDRALALRDLGPSVAVVTLGPGGAILAAGHGAQRFPAFAVHAVDSVGAGDAFCGALAVALAEGCVEHRAMRFASAAGAISVTRPGAAASLPTRREVEEFLAARL